MSFIVFDVVNYYPSITLQLLTQAITWAKEFVDISDEESDIIVETKKSLLVMNGEFWTKKGYTNFDVAQGGYDSAEVCDLVGLFLLSELKKLGLKASMGKFRDDGLALSYATPRQNEMVYKKKICEVYNKYNLDITVTTNKKVVQFLDVEFDIEKKTYKPFIKPNDVPLYVHRNSDHPESILRNIPLVINKRISTLSSSEEIFKSVVPLYQNALDKAGYSFKMKYDPDNHTTKKKNRDRKKDVLWFNPPYIKTSIGAKILKLIDKHFPKTHPLHKLINRKTTKIGYKTTSNMKKIISTHNQKVIK